MLPPGVARASEWEFTCLPEARTLGRLHRRKRKLVQDVVNGRMARTGADLSIFMETAGQQLQRYFYLSRSFWRICTQAASKQQLDCSNVVKGEGVEVATDDIAERWGPSQSTDNQESGAYDVETATATAEGTRAAVLLNDELLRRVALAEDADSAMAIISQSCRGSGRTLGSEDCCRLIQAALAESNANLAFLILNAMRSSQIQRRVGRNTVGWRWPQPDVRTYIALVKGLAASLRITDAIQTVGDVKRRGIPAGEEVPFGKVVKCPTCETALAVVQPHHGIQLVPCSQCRYQYELLSGDVVNCESESISMNISAFERGLRALQLKKQPLPSAIHSVVVRSPDGMARTHRFATASADVPAQEGERITVAAAAPINSSMGLGPFKVSARAPGWRPSEPMSITNHVTGRISPLLRAPPKSGSGAALDTSVIIPAAFFLASSDAATALIDPTLPRTIAIGAAAAAVLGTAANTWILPRVNQLPQRTADAIAVRQELLAQYEVLQARLQDLTQGAAEEVRILARMCQLQNKMEAVREPTYSARMERVRKAREGLDERLASRLELIDNYAKVSSMIEIEVEMDVDVVAAEAGGAVASIAAQIERLAEVENLQKQWRMQAEVNDELEKLLQSSPVLPDSS